MSSFNVKVDNGKYEIRNLNSNGPVKVYRHGEPWQELHNMPGGKMIMAMAYELQELRKYIPHEPKLVLGEIIVCRSCKNSEGNPVDWTQAHPGANPYDLDAAIRQYKQVVSSGLGADKTAQQLFNVLTKVLMSQQEELEQMVQTELLATAEMLPIDLWATFGGVPRDKVIAIQDWLREQAGKYTRDNPQIRDQFLKQKLTTLILGKTAPQAAEDLVKYLMGETNAEATN